MEILKWRLSLLAVLIAFVFIGFAASSQVQAVPVTSEPVITVERTACDELTLTVTTTISHPNEDTGHYVLLTGWLNDGIGPASHTIPSGVEVHTYIEIIDLPFDGDTFRAVLDVKGLPYDVSDELEVEETDADCATATPVPPTATAVPPTATATAVPPVTLSAICEGSNLVYRTNSAITGIVVNSPNCVAPTAVPPAPVIATATPLRVTSVIRPPSTGDAGLQ